jgi:hypothetical protein
VWLRSYSYTIIRQYSAAEMFERFRLATDIYDTGSFSHQPSHHPAFALHKKVPYSHQMNERDKNYSYSFLTDSSECHNVFKTKEQAGSHFGKFKRGLHITRKVRTIDISISISKIFSGSSFFLHLTFRILPKLPSCMNWVLAPNINSQHQSRISCCLHYQLQRQSHPYQKWPRNPER